MALQPPVHSGKYKRLSAIISFATELQLQLPGACSSPPGPLVDDLQRNISSFPVPKALGEYAASRSLELDSNGTALWNLCTRIRRNYDTNPTAQNVHIILLLARVFAFLLLDCALVIGKGTASNVARVMKIGIKVTKYSLEMERIECAVKVLGSVGALEPLLTQPDADTSEDDTEIYKRLLAEYYVLRTALSWKQDRLDMAEHMYKKSISYLKNFDPSTAESLADVLFEMGKDLLNKQQYQNAVTWLERSYEVIGDQELDMMSTNISELNLSIAESLIKSHLALQTADGMDKASTLLDTLEQTRANRLVVSMLRLEFLGSKARERFDSAAYGNTIHTMSCFMILSEPNFKLVMHHIRKLNDESPSLACKALDAFVRMRLFSDVREAWLEKVVITRIWMAVKREDSAEALASLKTILSDISKALEKPASSAVTLAAHTLLWKEIEATYAQSQFDATEHWCRLAMHHIFESSGELNLARMSRKLLLCALARNDYSVAMDVYGSMPHITKNEPMTRFLMYKIAIRCKQFELAAECLELVSRSTGNKNVPDPTLLYACALDAQQVGNKQQALTALQLVTERFSSTTSFTTHLPSLLRLTIKLSCSLLDDLEGKLLPDTYNANVEKLCKLFEGCVAAMKKPPLSTNSETLWTIPELDWFSKNSYNLAIKYISSWTPKQLLRILICCIGFIDRYPDDVTAQTSDDLSLRKMFCEFSAATALVALAREQDEKQLSLQYYVDLRKHVDNYDHLLQEKLPKMMPDDGPARDLLQKLAILIAFDFEAACHLKSWGQLGDIILRAETCGSPRVYEIMADCILSIKDPSPALLVATLKKIVNQAWRLDSFDSVKLAKYMRCLFQVALSENPDAAESLLDQIEQLAEEASNTEQPYPREELEWIATRAFNHAVDLYCSEQDSKCKHWALKAIKIAHFCTDNGDLQRLLRTKWTGLNLD